MKIDKIDTFFIGLIMGILGMAILALYIY